jgi:hypothetical protein
MTVIDQSEQHYFQGADLASVTQTMQNALYQCGVGLHQTGPDSWTGRANAASYGMTAKVSLSAQRVGEGFSVNLRVSPDFEGTSLIIFIVLWVVFFPAAIIVAVLAYQDFQNRGTHLMRSVWSPVQQHMVKQHDPYGFVPPRR